MDIIHLENRLNQIYTGDILIDIHKIFLVQILDANPHFYKEWGLDENEFRGVYIRKKQLARLLAIILNDPNLTEQLIQLLPKHVKEVIEIIAWEGRQDIDHLQQTMQIDVLKNRPTIHNDIASELHTDFCLFTLRSFENALRPGTFCYTIDLPEEIKPALKPHFSTPSGFYLNGKEALPEVFTIFADKGDILRVLPLIQDFVHQGQLKLTQKGLPGKSSLKRLQKFCELNEFYPHDSQLKLNTFRIELLLHLLLQVNLQSNTTSPLAFLENIFSNYKKWKDFPHLGLLSHLKGWQYLKSKLRDRVQASYLNLLGELPEDEWISTDQILRFCTLREIDLSLVNEVHTSRYLYFSGYWKGWGSTKTTVSHNLEKDLIRIPLIKAIFFLYASFGLIDIAYHPPENTFIQQGQESYLTIYDGLTYFRLTSLGAYISGKKAEYSNNITGEQSAEIYLDEKRLLIVLSKSDKPLELLLDRFSRRIGKTRFAIDFISFFQDCNNIKDLKNRIMLFKERIHPAPPENWIHFFRQCVQRVDPLILESEMVVFRLPADNKDLIALISKNKEVNQLILKAENHHLVISKKNVPKVKRWLEKQGYLL